MIVLIEAFLDRYFDEFDRKQRRMERNQALIARCERLTGKHYETYAEAIKAWDDAGLFLPWRRWRAERAHTPRVEVVDFSKMTDRDIANFYAAHFPGRFTKAEIERGIGRGIDWAAVDQKEVFRCAK